jgi:hypothetical protein
VRRSSRGRTGSSRLEIPAAEKRPWQVSVTTVGERRKTTPLTGGTCPSAPPPSRGGVGGLSFGRLGANSFRCPARCAETWRLAPSSLLMTRPPRTGPAYAQAPACLLTPGGSGLRDSVARGRHLRCPAVHRTSDDRGSRALFITRSSRTASVAWGSPGPSACCYHVGAPGNGMTIALPDTLPGLIDVAGLSYLTQVQPAPVPRQLMVEPSRSRAANPHALRIPVAPLERQASPISHASVCGMWSMSSRRQREP